VLRGQLPPGLRGWLLDGGSLTRRVRSACGGVFGIRVISQRLARPMREEAAALGQPPHLLALVREVQLLCDERPWVFARSVIPMATLAGARSRLGPLDSRPLGEVLFTDPTTVRGPVEVARIDRCHELYPHAIPNDGDHAPMIWGRRSVFRIHNHALLVAEIFLPSLSEPAHGETGGSGRLPNAGARTQAQHPEKAGAGLRQAAV